MGSVESCFTNHGVLACFGLGIRSNAPIHGIPFVFWLLVGISMWFFINQGVLEGTKSISEIQSSGKDEFPTLNHSYLYCNK